MKNVTLEFYLIPNSREVATFRSTPAFGESHEPTPGHRVVGVLRNEQYRVKFGVYNGVLDIEQIKDLARQALVAKPENYRV
jgi:hypothetical protein